MVPRVLHIDDEAPIRLLARLNLEWEDELEVIEAADGLTGGRGWRRSPAGSSSAQSTTSPSRSTRSNLPHVSSGC